MDGHFGLNAGTLIKGSMGKFAGGPVVKLFSSTARGMGSIFHWGVKILHAEWVKE